MRSLEQPTDRGSALGLSYLLGSYATEVLVAVYGQDKMVKFLREFKTSNDLDSNFERIYPISVDTFYGKLAPYLAEMATELSN